MGAEKRRKKREGKYSGKPANPDAVMPVEMFTGLALPTGAVFDKLQEAERLRIAVAFRRAVRAMRHKVV